MEKVATTPALPLLFRTNEEGHTLFIRSLLKALFNILREHAQRLNAAILADGSNRMDNPLPLSSYTVAGLPDATEWVGSTIYVSNEAGGATMAFSDGTNWRRAQDRVVVS